MRKSVLIVDDNEDNREYARQVLSSSWSIDVAMDGLNALEHIQLGPPDLVLLDLSMPQLDGWELLKVLKGAEETAGIPVVACTAHAMDGDREHTLASGFDAYIAKPYRPQELVETVEAFLGPGEAGDGDDGWGGDDWSFEDDEGNA